MFVQSELGTSLVSAYRETEYQITEGEPFVLRVDERCPALLGLYRAKNVKSNCVIAMAGARPMS